MTFDGLSLLAWIVGLGFLYLCYRVACDLDAAERIGPEHPEAVTGLDRLQADGYAKFTNRDAA